MLALTLNATLVKCGLTSRCNFHNLLLLALTIPLLHARIPPDRDAVQDEQKHVHRQL